MKKRSCPYCGVEQQVLESQLSSPWVFLKCHQCHKLSAAVTSKHTQPSLQEINIKKLFVPKAPPQLSQPFHINQVKRNFLISVIALLVAVNFYLVQNLREKNKNINFQELNQELRVSASAPVNEVKLQEKEIITKWINRLNGKVQVPRAIVRSGPGGEYSPVYTLLRGHLISINDWKKNWLKVEYSTPEFKNKMGWVRSDLLESSNVQE